MMTLVQKTENNCKIIFLAIGDQNDDMVPKVQNKCELIFLPTEITVECEWYNST